MTMFELPAERTPDRVDRFGDWFRYLTGMMQVGGAMLAWIFFLGSPGSAVIPAVIIAMLIALAANASRSG